MGSNYLIYPCLEREKERKREERFNSKDRDNFKKSEIKYFFKWSSLAANCTFCWLTKNFRNKYRKSAINELHALYKVNKGLF